MYLNVESTSTNNTMTSLCVIKYLIGLEIEMASSLRKTPKLHDDIRRATTEKFIIILIEKCCHSVYFKIAEEIQDTIVALIFVGVKRAL